VKNGTKITVPAMQVPQPLFTTFLRGNNLNISYNGGLASDDEHILFWQSAFNTCYND